MNSGDFDFQEYVENNMDFDGRPGGTMRINCVDPDCDDNWKRGRHLYVYPEGLPYCFKCQQRFKPIDFVMKYEECNVATAQRRLLELKKRAPVPESPLEEIMAAYHSSEPIRAMVPEVELPFSQPIEEGDGAWAYLRGRGFGKEIIDHFGLSFVKPYSGEFSGRILIPVYFDGRLVGYQGRTIKKGQEPKYLFPPGDEGSKHLYNWDEALSATKSLPVGSRLMILVEGITDQWRNWLYGYKNTVATFGKALKPNQRRMILAERDIDGVILFWDGNAADEIEKTADDLAEFKRVGVVDLPFDKEPDTVSKVETDLMISQATYWNGLSELDKLERKLGRIAQK